MNLDRLKISQPAIKEKVKEYDFDKNQNISTSYFLTNKGSVKYRVLPETLTDCLSEEDYYQEIKKYDDYIFLIDGCFNVLVYSAIDDNEVKRIVFSEIGEQVKIIPLTVNGARKYLIANEYDIRLYNNTLSTYTSLSIPFGEYIQYSGRLFVGKGSEIRYSAPFDFSNFTVSANLGGYIKLEERDGDLINMFVINDRLYIVCKNNILVFDCNGEEVDYSIKRLSISGYDIIPKSVVQSGNTIYFAGTNKIYELRGENLQYTEINIDNAVIFEETPAVIINNFYVVSLSYGITNPSLFFDTSTKKMHLAKINFPISNYGGYSIDENNCLCKVNIYLQNVDINRTNRFYTTLDTIKKKRISIIEVENDKTANLLVYSDEMTHSFPLKSGLNVIKCSVFSKEFGFAVSGAQNDFTLKKLRLTYSVYE